MLLHGYMASKECFVAQIEYFSRSYRVTAPDFPGFGKAEPLTEAFSVGDYALWLSALISSLELNDPVILAHSFGGRVALKGIAEGILPCKALILTGGAGVVRHGFSYRLRVKLYRAVRKIAPRFAESHFGSEEYKTLSPVMRESYKKIVNEDLVGCASRVSVPTLLLYGAEDTVTPKYVSETLHGAIGGSRLVYLADAGHFAFLDRPVAFNLTTEEFLGVL